jgi:hypothetical protein
MQALIHDIGFHVFPCHLHYGTVASRRESQGATANLPIKTGCKLIRAGPIGPIAAPR